MPSEISSSVHIFDCDGVILDSNSLKLSALRSSLEFINVSSNFIDWAVQEFRMNFGRTRINHFDTFLRHAENKGYSLTKKMVLKAMSNYSENVVRLYRNCRVIEETNKYIESLPSDPNRYFEEMVHKFVNPIRVLAYVVSFGFLMLHLLHGFSSSFQSVGLNNKYTRGFKTFTIAFSIVIPVGFIFIAIFHHLNA